jgi:hypothetical protein
MATIRERIANVLLGDERRKLEQSAKMLYDAYLEGPWQKTPERLVGDLMELDSSILQDLLLQLGWEAYGAGYSWDNRQQWERAVDESRRLWTNSVAASWMVNLWTNYGMGENIIVTPLDDGNLKEADDDEPTPLAVQVWHDFWEADHNQAILSADKIHELSNWTLIDGERFLAFYISDLDGEARVRTIDPKEIVEIVCDPNDADTPWFYKRQFTDSNKSQLEWYYPDWRLFFSDDLESAAEAVLDDNDVRADKLNNGEDDEIGVKTTAGTVVCVLHIAHNRKEANSLRGWPLLAPAGAPWVRGHKKFREDRAAVAAAAAMFAQKISHSGGSRAGEALRTTMQTALTATSSSYDANPPPVAGSTWIGNEAVDLEKLHNIGTAAGDAKNDGEAMLLMAGLSGGVYPHWMGAGDAYRLATATSMEGPMLRQFSRYQQFWSAQFRKMVRIVLQAYEKYNPATFETYDAEVSTDRLVEADLEVITSALSRFFKDVIGPQIEAGTIDQDAVKAMSAATSRIVLQALGVAEADEIASDEAFGVGVEVEPEPEEEEPEPVLPEELMLAVRERYEAGESTAEALVDWALVTLAEMTG